MNTLLNKKAQNIAEKNNAANDLFLSLNNIWLNNNILFKIVMC